MFRFAVVVAHVAEVREGGAQGEVFAELVGAADVAEDRDGGLVVDGLRGKPCGGGPAECLAAVTEACLYGPGVGAVFGGLEAFLVAAFDFIVAQVFGACREGQRKVEQGEGEREVGRREVVGGIFGEDDVVHARFGFLHGTHGERVSGNFGGALGVGSSSSREGGAAGRHLHREELHRDIARVNVPVLPGECEGGYGESSGDESFEHTDKIQKLFSPAFHDLHAAGQKFCGTSLVVGFHVAAEFRGVAARA